MENKNLFDIFGIQRNENIISNLLEYFFEKSSLKQEFKNSLGSLLGIEDFGDFENIDRESTTDNKNRLDLILVFEKYVIGIENKIDTDDSHNPYGDYNKYLKKIAKEDRQYRLILLSVKQEESFSKEKIFLTNIITYRSLLEKVENQIKSNEISYIDKKIFDDFYDNIENLEKSTSDFEELQKKIQDEIQKEIGNKYKDIKEKYSADVCLYENSTFFNKSWKRKQNSNFITLVIFGSQNNSNISENDILFREKNKTILNLGVKNQIDIPIKNKKDFVNKSVEIGKKLIEEFLKKLEH